MELTTIPLDTFGLICKSLGHGFRNDVFDISKIENDLISFDVNKYEEIRKKYLPQSPDLMEKIKALASDSSEWAKSGFKTATTTKLEDRLAICKGCEFWDQKGFGNTGKCTKCGCSTQAKLRMATAKCPIDKWGAIEVVKTD
jgi:hypothetical protein